MRYFIDTEFNGFRGELISLAICAEDGREGYLVMPELKAYDPWVAEHVLPVIDGTEECPTKPARYLQRRSAAIALGTILAQDPEPIIMADWPADIAHVCQLLEFEGGEMFPLSQLQFVFFDIPGFSTAEASQVPHNALCDARAFRDYVLAAEKEPYPAHNELEGDGVVGD